MGRMKSNCEVLSTGVVQDKGSLNGGQGPGGFSPDKSSLQELTSDFALSRTPLPLTSATTMGP